MHMPANGDAQETGQVISFQADLPRIESEQRVNLQNGNNKHSE